ncbi:unnamed protein product [Thelazia callipaeda]|uniref:Uncharacterized protein n=1 Tax=Thelazia callipaeda TaxID=103827 RepID=A0A0N5DCD2_THECL|nr:unnamed protein product [Thelazia callipaeda]
MQEKMVNDSPTLPLQVIVNATNQSQQVLPEATISFMASSPASSVDSGMSSLSSSNSSPASSPNCSPISVDNIPFHYGTNIEQIIVPRNRSTSESISVVNGLKSILKKSTVGYITVGRFTRSYSECQSREESEINGIIVDKNCNNDKNSVDKSSVDKSFVDESFVDESFVDKSFVGKVL